MLLGTWTWTNHSMTTVLTVAIFDRTHCLEIILTEQLFPDALPVEQQSKHSALAFATYDEVEKEALQFVLSQKQRYAFWSLC